MDHGLARRASAQRTHRVFEAQKSRQGGKAMDTEAVVIWWNLSPEG
jgi:hypothetical protein